MMETTLGVTSSPIPDEDLPLIVFCVSGVEHLVYATWCIRSLLAFDYPAIEVNVATEKEKRTIEQRFPALPCKVVRIERGDYPAFSYKPFALTEYLDEHGFQHVDRDIVVCDADILWIRDPRPLFRRFAGANWVHKITAVSPADYDMAPEDVPAAYISLRTIQNFDRRYGVAVYPTYVVNAGLFLLPRQVFPRMLENWMSKIQALPGDEMLMSEALMALTYAEMGITPTSDAEDIKHHGRESQPAGERKTASFVAVSERPSGAPTGYQTAKHYFGEQRDQMIADAAAMGLDHDGLSKIIAQARRARTVDRMKRAPRKIVSRILGL